MVVTAVMTLLAVTAGRGWGSVVVGLAVLTGQLSVGWSNDWIDRERDRLAGRSDKPIVAGAVAANTVVTMAGIAAFVCVPLSYASGLRAGTAHLVGVAAAWGYNAWLKSTVLSVAPYVVAFGLLPGLVTWGLPGSPAPPWWAVAAGALLGAGAHFANALPDLSDDARTGVRGLPHRLGRTTSTFAAAALLASAVVVLAGAAAPSSGPARVGAFAMAGASLCCAVGVAVAGRVGRPRTGWHLTMVTAVLAVGLLLLRGSSLG